MNKFYSKNTFFCLPKIHNLLFLFLLTLVSYSGFGQILQRGSSTSGQTNNQNSFSINRPTGVNTGDVLILNVAQRGNNTLGDATASGWTKITGSDLGTNGGTFRRATIYYKIATGSEPANYSVSPDSNHTGSIGSIIAFSGVDVTSGPFDVTPGSINTSNSSAATASSITTVSANAAIIMLTQAVGSDPFYSNWSTSSPGTLTELYDDGINNRVSIGAAWEIKSGIGSTGTGTNSLTNSERNGAILLALKPICPTRPGTPGTMTGPSAPCAGSTGIVYSVPTLTNAATYEWTVPSGWTITSGLNTNSITVTVGSSGNITVVGVSSCGEKSYTSSQMNIGVVALPLTPGTNSSYNPTCTGFTAQWGYSNNTTSYFLDVATDSGFLNIVPAYNNFNAGNVLATTFSGLSSGTTYFYRVRASSTCGTSGNSGTMSGTTTGPAVGTTSSNQSVCSGNSPADITLTGSTGTVQWQSSTDNSSFSNISGATSSILTSAQMGVLTATRYYRAMLTNSGCTSYSTVVTVTVTASTLSTTGPTICVGGSGTFTASGVCGSGIVNTGSTISSTSIAGNWNGTSDSAAPRIVSYLANSTACNFSTIQRNYVATSFQVTTTGNYEFSMTPNGAYDGMGYITTGAFVPGNCSGGGTWVIGDDDSNSDLEPKMNATLTAGITYTLISTTYSTSNGTYTGSFNWTIVPPAGGQIINDPRIDWYTSSTGGTAIGSGTPFNPVGVAGSGLANTNTAGTTIFYAACSTNPGCRTATSFTINAAPATPGTITQPTNKCASATGNTFSIAAVTGATSYTWSVTGTGWSVAAGGTTTSATITIGSGAGTVSVTATNACGTSSSSSTGSITPTTAPATPGTITQPTNKCASTTGNTFSIAAVTGATSYTWSVTGTGWSVTAGGTTSSATITIGSGAGTVSVTATNACGTSSSSSTGSITPTTAPATPGTITQPTNKCASTTGNTFSIAAVTGATSYTWSVTGTGWSVTAGGTTSSATITIGSGAGTVSVTATNACGTSSSSSTGSITPTTAPATPGTITQPTNKCTSTTGNTFSIAAVTGATSYTWSVTGTGWSVTAGGTTSSATITIGSGAGTVSVTAINACGTSSSSSTGSITPTTAPATPGTITQPTNKCTSTTGNTFSIAAVIGATSYSWSVTGTGWSVTAGGTTSSATITIGSGAGTVSVTAINACGTSSSSSTGSITPTTAPATPGTITQPTNKCTSTTGNTFSIAAVTGATSYTWSVTGTGWSVTAGGTTSSATITIGSGAGTVSVTATNACGTSWSSSTGSIAVNTAPVGLSYTLASPVYCMGSAITTNSASLTTTGSPTPTYTISPALPAGLSISSTTGAITGTPTVVLVGANYMVSATNACGIASSIVNITVNNVPTIAAITSPLALCSGGSLNPTAPTVTANGSAVAASGWQLETGVGSGTFANLTVPYTVAFADNGKKIRYYAMNGCGTTNSNEVTITVEDVLTAPTPGTKTQPNCITPTGSVYLSDLPSGSWTINPGGIAGSGSTTTITGLVAGTYNFTVTNSTGCVSGPTVDVVIIGAVTNTWDGAVWSNGLPTSMNDRIVFDGNYNENANVNGCACTVSANKNVVIQSGYTLKITNEVIVDPTATLTFENNASLVQINDTPSIANSGNITYIRETTRVSNFDYTYWSTPVSPQTLYDVSPGTLGDKFYSLDSAIEDWRQENSANTMLVGTGYIIRGPQSYAAPAIPNFYPASFIGVPNNGVVKTPIGIAGNSNLIGNPYPSALFADAFISANLGVIEGTIYFWTHNTNIGIGVSNPGSGIYAYSSDDYASYNLTGGVATTDDPTAAASSAGPNTNVPNGMITAGQAFLTTSVAPGEAVFNNSMRLDNSGSILDNTQFFKIAPKGKTVSTTQKSRLWLNLKNSQGAFKQTLVGYVAGATNDYDIAYDGISYDSNEFIDFYSVFKGSSLVIQGRGLPFEESDLVPLGYSSVIAGNFTISIGQVDGVLVNENVYLEDKLLGVIHDLKTEAYSFSTEKGVFNDRFVLRYTRTNKTLAIDDFDNVKNGVLVSSKNKEIQIKSSDELIDKVVVFDFSGRQLYSKTKIAASDYKIQTLIPTDQGLIVKVVLQNGQIVSKKIIF